MYHTCIMFILDELILVEMRPVSSKENCPEEILKGPNEEAIANVTSDLPIRNPPQYIPPVNFSFDVILYFC